jgi:AcrR family transcriptional regulator
MQMKKSDTKRQAILETAYGLFCAQGFAKTSMTEITHRVGGSKATIYNHFASKEELFVECMMAAADNYMSGTLKHLDVSGNPESALSEFGASVLEFICSAEQLEVRRLMIAEAARSGTGKLFFKKLRSLRARVAGFLSDCMSIGVLRPDDPYLAADHLGALLEAELVEPLLLKVREDAPDKGEISRAATRAVNAFLRAYGTARAPIDANRRSGKRSGANLR